MIVGTAGHIDHGKTALVKALTGVDADRLPEEKRRGITVDLGFAEMTIGDAHFGFVDVPGHERFVKNMLAGASGIDLVLLVIAADEGVMPQTREHFDICRLLDVEHGVIALTKSDLADKDTLELARVDAAELVAGSFLEGSPMIAVSSRTGAGVDELKAALAGVRNFLKRADRSVRAPILAIDRSFTMKGFGAVVTGTLASGTMAEGDELELLPIRKKVRVRGLQTHGQTVTTASAGQRVAVNLAGVDHSDITRGMRLVEPGTLRPTQMIDARVEMLPTAAKPLRSRARVRVHIGTAEVLARVDVLNSTGEIAPGDADLAQLRFEIETVATVGERFIIRSYSPQHTIAGGIVIDNSAVKHRKSELADVRVRLAKVHNAFDDRNEITKLLVEAGGQAGISFVDLRARMSLREDILNDAIKANLDSGRIVDADGIYISAEDAASLEATSLDAIAKFHAAEPLAKGMAREALRDKLFRHLPPQVFQTAVARLETGKRIVVEKDVMRLSSHAADLPPADAAMRDKLFASFQANGLAPPKLDEVIDEAAGQNAATRDKARKLIQLLLNAGDIVKVTDEFYFASAAIDRLKETLKTFAATSSGRMIDVPKFKDLAGISRKYAIPLLEYFDRERVTVRVGDKRKIL